MIMTSQDIQHEQAPEKRRTAQQLAHFSYAELLGIHVERVQAPMPASFASSSSSVASGAAATSVATATTTTTKTMTKSQKPETKEEEKQPLLLAVDSASNAACTVAS
jgi:hypothetical protein